MSLSKAGHRGYISMTGNGYTDRLQFTVTEVRLPYGNSTADRIRKFLHMESAAESALRKQLYAIAGVDSPDLRISPRRPGKASRYEFTTHLQESLPGTQPGIVHAYGQQFIVLASVKAGVQSVFTDAFAWTSCKLDTHPR